MSLPQEDISVSMRTQHVNRHKVHSKVFTPAGSRHRGVLPSCGFSYDPEIFMAAGVGMYNFSWRDMGIPTLHKMMDLDSSFAKVMVHVTEEEHLKVAVHCHAGLGRTGLAVACFLVFLGDCDACGAVAKVRRGRPGALQTHQQEHFVQVFQMYLTHLRSAHSPRAPAVHQAASSSPVHRLHSSTGQHAAGPDAAQSTSKELGALQAAVGSAAQQTDAVAAAIAPAGDDATAVSAAEAAGESAVHADTARFAAVADSPAVEGSLQGQAWAEQAACSTAGSLEDSAFVGRDLSVSEAVVHHTALQAAAGHQHDRFRMPWLMARRGSKASKVHALDPARNAADRLEVLWSEDGFIKAGSRHNLHKGQVYRASPPGHLQEALARQRRLLHGQELRQYWNLPKVVDMIAAAFEHAAKDCPCDFQLTQANAQYAPRPCDSQLTQANAQHASRPCDHDRPSASVAAQLAVVVAHGAGQADVQAAESIVLKVNCGTWDDLMAASPVVLMQLLQLWFQTFHEPVLSVSQQKAISSILGSYTRSNTGSADMLFSPCMQAAGHEASDTAELSATQDASPPQQQHTELCVAVAEHLSVPQKALIARLVRSFRAMAGNQADDNTVYPLMQWLASALTLPQRQLDGLKDGLTAEQTALVFFLTHCDIGLLWPRTTGWCKVMPHADVVTDVVQTTDDTTRPCVGVSLHGANSQKPCLVATEEQSRIPQSSHGQHANGGPKTVPSPDRGWDADEHGCLWLHSKMAKKALVKFVMLSGRTGAPAQRP
ncbi:TPA: hypothetical protein ACH3X1_001813 [Trebouxia sp. C0004]